MATNHIQEVFRNSNEIIGAHIVLCANDEIVGESNDVDSADAEQIICKMVAALDGAGWYFSSSISARFADWRGGRYSQGGDTLAVLWYVSGIDEDGEAEQWRSIWRWGAGATEIPAEAIAVIDSVGGIVYAAAEREAELINADSR